MLNNWSNKKVLGIGPKNAKIMFIGEAPGQSEDETGIPFAGSAGKVLDSLLEDVGLERKDVYITNVVKYRPRNNNFFVFYDKIVKDGKKINMPCPLLRDSIKELKAEIEEIKPNVIVPLGNEALNILTGQRGIVKRRGSIYSYKGIKVIPAIHPAAIIRKWEWRAITYIDFKRILKESKTPENTSHKRNLIVNYTKEEIIDYLDNLIRAKKPISFDIETAVEQITCIGFANSPFEALTIPIWNKFEGSSVWFLEEEVEIWMKIKEVLESDVPKIAQNGQFDVLFLHDQMGIDVNNLTMDTMIMGHLAYPELPKGLAFLVSIYTREPYYKDQIKSGRMDEYLRYNALDACCTYEVAEKVYKELKELGLWEFYTSYINKLITPLLDMSKRGVKIDLVLRRQMIKEAKAEIKQLKKTIDKSAWKALPKELKTHYCEIYLQEWIKRQVHLETAINGNGKKKDERIAYLNDKIKKIKLFELNVGSVKQMCLFLYDALEFPKQYKGRKSNEGFKKTITADEEAIEKLNKKTPLPVLQDILRLRELQKILSTYLEAKVDSDGRMRTSYLITGTETGRLAARKYLRDIGTNFQNIPKGPVRRLFIPDKGKVFISADLSQAEARIVAYLAGEESLIRLFQEGGKIHKKVASDVFRISEDSITDAQYNIAKKLVHASNYGMGYNTFAKEAGVSVAEAKKLQNAYFAAYPGIKMRQMHVEHQLKKSRRLSTPLGRKRLFLAKYNKEMLKDGYAYQPQSTVADLLNMGLLEISSRLPGGCEPLLQVHDEIVLQCLPRQVPHIISILQEHLTRELDIKDINGRLRTCIVPVEFKVGHNWWDMQKYNPGGSRKWVDKGHLEGVK